MDTDRPDRADDEANDANDPYEPVELTASVDDTVYTEAVDTAEPVAAPKSRLLLGTLAGILVVLVGTAAWAGLYIALNRDYVGIAVVIALGIGYVVREVSRRSDLPPRVIAAVLAVLLCVFGSTTAVIAKEANDFSFPFFTLWKDAIPDSFKLVKARPALQLVIFAAAVVVAFLSASPTKPKTKPAPAPADDPVDPVDPADEG